MRTNMFLSALVYTTMTLLPISFTAAQDNKDHEDIVPIAPLEHKKLHQLETAPRPFSTRAQICDKYAKDTVQQLEWLQKNDCGYGENPILNSRIIISYDIEYNNCMNKYPRRLGEKAFELSDIPIKLKQKQKAIADCICSPYAESAVRQNEENLLLDCGYKGSKWNSRLGHHYDWCAQGGGKIIELASWERFSVDREEDLNECKKPFAPANLRPNGETIHKDSVRLTWDDQGKDKAQAALEYKIKMAINGKETLDEKRTDESFLINRKLMPYGANVSWKVRGVNNSGSSPWSSASFKIVSGPPEISNFTRDPDKKSYTIGEQVTLKWNVKCPLECDVTLYGGINGDMFKSKNLPKSGSKKVVGLVQDKAYKLIVKSGKSTVYETVSVQTRPKPADDRKQFFFKAKCPSAVDPCTTVTELGKNSEEAEQAAKQRFGANCTFEEISASDYFKGC